MNRVKSLSKSGNTKKDPSPAVNKESSSAPSTQVFTEVDDVTVQHPEPRAADAYRRPVENDNVSYNPSFDYEKESSVLSTSYNYNGRNVNGATSGSFDRDKPEMKSSYAGSTSQKTYASYAQNSADAEEDVQNLSPPRRKISSRDERTEKLGNWLKKEGGVSDHSALAHKSQGMSSANGNNVPVPSRHYEPESSLDDGNIDAILEVGLL